MEVVIEHLGAVQSEIRARGHAIVADQPRELGGFDEGMIPPELLLASLGSCAAFYAAQYLRKYNLATEGTRVCVTAEKEKNPAPPSGQASSTIRTCPVAIWPLTFLPPRLELSPQETVDPRLSD